MKKAFFTLLGLMFFFVSFSQLKEIDKNTCRVEIENFLKSDSRSGEWAQTGNFTATDINGVEHDLQTYLDQGKYVVIDFSAVWCGPCWSLHGSGNMDDIHNNYGPEGTDEMVMLWVEVEGASLAEIEGGGDSQGDWTNGGTWPVPIISSTTIIQGFLDLYEGYVPTVFMVCPSGYYRNVTEEIWTSAEAVYNLIDGCPAAGNVPTAVIEGPSSGFVNTDLSFSDASISVEPITAYAWTFEGGNPATSEDANPTVTWETDGNYSVTLITTNENGNSEQATKTITIIDPANADDKFVTFEECIVGSSLGTDFAPYNWTAFDADGGTVWGDFSDYGVSGEGNSFNVYSFDLIGGDYQAYQGDKCGFAMTNNPGAGNGTTNDDWFISPQIQLGTGSSFDLFVRSTDVNWGQEKYQIAISTTDNNVASFTIIGGVRNAPANWTEINVDLSNYDNQNVYIAVNYVGEDTYAFLIDNLTINTTTVNVDNNTAFDISVFPNPSKGLLNINFAKGANVIITNIAGQNVMNLNNIDEYNQIDISKFESGTYFVTVINGEQIHKEKILLIK